MHFRTPRVCKSCTVKSLSSAFCFPKGKLRVHNKKQKGEVLFCKSSIVRKELTFLSLAKLVRVSKYEQYHMK